MNFKFLCIDSAGNEQKGVLSALDRNKARVLLKERGLNVVSLEEKESSSSKGQGFFKGKSFNDNDLYNTARELSVLLRAGLRIDSSLETIVGSTPNDHLKEILSNILQDLRAGESISKAFEERGDFSPLIITMMKVGESVGDLKIAFEYIARHLKFQIGFRSEIRNSLTYPIFLIFASIVTLFVIFKFIIPKFFTVFGEDQIQSLPFAAKMLYSLSGYMNIYLIGAVVLSIILFLRYTNLKRLFAAGYSIALSLPVLNKLIINLEMSRFSYSMYTMLSSGIEFIKALKFSTDLIQNLKIRNSIEPSIKYIKEGRGITEVFSQIDLLPDIVVNMVSVGEKSGNMQEIFLEIFNVFDDRFKSSVKRMVILIEPLIISIMGLVVGFIVISLILTVTSVGNIKL